jgi:hypothetical protein
MQGAAFTKAFDVLSREESTAPRAHQEIAARSVSGNGQKIDDPIAVLVSQLDRTAYPEISDAHSTLDNSLRLLQAAKSECGVDGLTPGQISKVLSDKFRIRTAANTVNVILAGAGSKVDRKPQGRTYIYRIMASGESHLNSGAHGTGIKGRQAD